MHVDVDHFESCLKDSGTSGLEIMVKVILFGKLNEPSLFSVLHAVLLLVLIEFVHIHQEDEFVELRAKKVPMDSQ